MIAAMCVVVMTRDVCCSNDTGRFQEDKGTHHCGHPRGRQETDDEKEDLYTCYYAMHLLSGLLMVHNSKPLDTIGIVALG